MPEKTLKEKVEWARVALTTGSPDTERAVQEALTALEERNECLWLFIQSIEDRFDEYDLWRDNKDLLEVYEKLRKEAPDNGGK